MRLKHNRLACVALLSLVLPACGGGDDVNDVEPMLIPGGGVTSGAVKGELNVYVIDGQTDQPIAGAAVRVGEAADAQPLTGTTDATGLVTFSDGGLDGGQVITVTAAGHAAATWFGANGANVTIPLDPNMDATPPTAHTAGTIAGWDTMTPPATANHYLAAFIFYSATADIGAPENNITQPMGTVLPRNVCIKVSGFPDPGCNWELTSRTGKQVHYAMLVDGDSHGTATDPSDDTFELIGFAFKANLDLSAGQDVSGEVLDQVAAGDMTDVSVTFPAAPTGLSTVVGVPVLDLGDQGQILLFAAPLSPTVVMTQVPALTGDLATGNYDLFARATASPMDEVPSSTSFLRNKDISATIDFPSWLPTPSDVTASQGTYTFGAVTGAALYTGEFQDSTGKNAWSVGLLDGRTTFSLPLLTPDALPAGDVTLEITALTFDTFDPQDFRIDDLMQSIDSLSNNSAMFTH